jgi:hypothetical protein
MIVIFFKKDLLIDICNDLIVAKLPSIQLQFFVFPDNVSVTLFSVTLAGSMRVTYLCVLVSDKLDSGSVALMLVYAVQLTSSFSWFMRQSAELQNGVLYSEETIYITPLFL